MNRAALGPVLVALSLGTAVVGCVLSDKEIEFEETAVTNRNAVRIIEPVLLSSKAIEHCEDDIDPMDPPCRQPGDADPARSQPHFLDPTYQETDEEGTATPFAFCSCAEDQFDSLPFDITVFVEDQDQDVRKRNPKDGIFPALLLDLPRDATEPANYVDYLAYYDPLRPLELTGDDYQPPGRRDPQLRALDLVIDLCNGGRTRLSKGFHTLTVMVSDRPWFKPDEGARQPGVPDIRGGGTWDSTHYVFACDAAPANEPEHPCASACSTKAPL
ncbi:hypothetical protein [Nannocystis bainbridge]|uniref:Lipoprotein n=1 Tax=Nannocystis bainbridge TaxID=2995303 RepID=A0ABT5E2J3_9BACT|nr:hypothetical protein [Nannocystis bainbridge]MDC0720087.1 hypothetical protein [Nannocystis bainbridge]